MSPPPTDTENALLAALHRAEFEKLTEFFGDKYVPLDGEELRHKQRDWLPLIRAFVARENARLRKVLEEANAFIGEVVTEDPEDVETMACIEQLSGKITATLAAAPVENQP